MPQVPSREWIVERLADYRAYRSHREVAAVESIIGQVLASVNVDAAARAERAEAVLACVWSELHDFDAETTTRVLAIVEPFRGIKCRSRLPLGPEGP